MSEVFAQQPHQLPPQMMVAAQQQQNVQRMVIPPSSETITKMLDDNTQLVTAINDHITKGRMQDTLEMQRTLHRNLVYLAQLAYPNKPTQEVQNLIPVIKTLVFRCHPFFLT